VELKKNLFFYVRIREYSRVHVSTVEKVGLAATKRMKGKTGNEVRGIIRKFASPSPEVNSPWGGGQGVIIRNDRTHRQQAGPTKPAATGTLLPPSAARTRFFSDGHDEKYFIWLARKRPE
jgi:hypothetical protein